MFLGTKKIEIELIFYVIIDLGKSDIATAQKVKIDTIVFNIN
jgi:hypothetical protein